MPPITLSSVLQVLVGLGLLNVWLLRSKKPTLYRGGLSTNLKGEFAAYGLPAWLFYVVGALKVGAGVALLAGLWVSGVVLPAAGTVSVLMVGALAMHAKVRDPKIKSLPAFAMLAMSGTLVYLHGV